MPAGAVSGRRAGIVALRGCAGRRDVVCIRRRDHGPAETDVAVVDDRRLPRRHGPLRPLEDELDGVRVRCPAASSQRARGVGLTVARLGRVTAVSGCRSGDPAGVVGEEAARQQPGVVVPGDDVEDIAREVLARDEPGCVLAADAHAAVVLEAADADPLALAQRVERQADVLADGPAAIVLDRPGRADEVAIEELAERPLADEADAGRVLLSCVRQADLGGDPAYFGLRELADRKQGARQLRLAQAVQEVALVLLPIEPLEQLEAPGPAPRTRA